MAQLVKNGVELPDRILQKNMQVMHPGIAVANVLKILAEHAPEICYRDWRKVVRQAKVDGQFTNITIDGEKYRLQPDFIPTRDTSIERCLCNNPRSRHKNEEEYFILNPHPRNKTLDRLVVRCNSRGTLALMVNEMNQYCCESNLPCLQGIKIIVEEATKVPSHKKPDVAKGKTNVVCSVEPIRDSTLDIKANDYVDFCEQLFQKWLEGNQYFAEFSRKFQLDYLPEPYYTSLDGNNPLYVLLSNPGHGIDKQLRENIKVRGAVQNYKSASQMMASYYWSDDFNRGNERNARIRMEKMRTFVQKLGMDGLVNTEAFFLHSPQLLDKKGFLKNFSTNKLVSKYTELLKRFLQNKTVLAITCIDSRASIDKEVLKNNVWITHLSKIMGLSIDNAKIIPITKKGENITSCIVVDHNKIMSISTATNNIPNISEEQYEEIREAMRER